MVLVMEYCPAGNLYDYLQSLQRLPEASCRVVARQLSRALHYLHLKSVAHRDCKAENVCIGYTVDFI